MNQKIARQFRKIAKTMATEDLQYGTLRNSKIYVPIDGFKKPSLEIAEGLAATIPTEAEMEAAKAAKAAEAVKEPLYAFHQGTVVVNRTSVKGIYKALKKAHRASK